MASTLFNDKTNFTTYYDIESDSTVLQWTDSDGTTHKLSSPMSASRTTTPYYTGTPFIDASKSHEPFYGHTAEEWLKIKKERDDLKKFIEEKLDQAIKDIKDNGKE